MNADQTRDELTPRRRAILRAVVEEHIATGHPVASKALAESGTFNASPSTLRYELAWLERIGLLDHPHTSAGRVPTESGYRLYALELIAERLPAATAIDVDLAHPRREIDDALRVTTETLSQLTNLLAVATAPSLTMTVIRHVEVLQLQPQLVMVVVITQTGTVVKRTFEFPGPVDPGLTEWARAYLNETVTGKAIGTAALRRALGAPDLGSRERAFLEHLVPVFSDVLHEGEERVVVGGASRLISLLRSRDVAELAELAARLERRAAMLELMQDGGRGDGVLVRLGSDHPDPVLQPLAVVAAGYGTPRRTLGTVSLVGPTRMDYGTAISAVRGAAAVLSEFVEELYEA